MSLTLGLIAAIAWAIHDVLIRYVSQRGGIMPSLITVVTTGTLIVLPIALVFGDFSSLSSQSLNLSLLSGVAFGLTGYAHYRAFSIGQVRLVAPIIGAYPLFSVAWAMLSGTPVTVLQWLAVFMVVGGVGFVAAVGNPEDTQEHRSSAIFWSIIAGCGVAITFALGQMAAKSGAELPVLLLTRVVAIPTILAIAYMTRAALRPQRAHIPILALMGLMDATALGTVLAAGSQKNPEFAAVAASCFGLITVLLAWAFLKEKMTTPQWCGVVVVFSAIAYLAA